MMDSGAGHLSPVESWLVLRFNLTRPGALRFDYSLSCPSSPPAAFQAFINAAQVPTSATPQPLRRVSPCMRSSPAPLPPPRSPPGPHYRARRHTQALTCHVPQGRPQR